MNLDLNGPFMVTADHRLKKVSSLYRNIQALARAQNIEYYFSASEKVNFAPWTNQVHLEPNFYAVHRGRVHVPFYSFNHENAHLTLFKEFYSNVAIEDSQLVELLLLIEWFCISMDLLLAYDLIASRSLHCLEELNTVASQSNRFFSQNCMSVERINEVADKFRTCMISGKSEALVNELISAETIEKHRSFAQLELVQNCRRVERSVSRERALEFRSLLMDAPLTECVQVFAKVQYGG